MMKREALIQLFNKLRSLAAETEVVEFKEAKNGYDSNDMGEYFSALSNEANLKQVASAWLIFGVKDKGHTVVGSNYRLDRKKLDHLKEEIANKTTNRITFIEIYDLDDPEGRIILFQIPAAPKGLPIAWEGHYYGRDGEALVPLNLEEIERIRSQATAGDWSAAICPDASLEDLDPLAIAKARENFKNKFPQKAVEVDGWNDLTFLNKAKLTLKGKITR
ncbi:MAG TPA: ATP-binding protein, partial [Syntrophales bacterium]|nr:ATP-binding protein [Syntrophales bacterium]